MASQASDGASQTNSKAKELKNKMDDRSYRQDARQTSGRFGNWLSSRPAESWMFLAIGVVIGGLFF